MKYQKYISLVFVFIITVIFTSCVAKDTVEISNKENIYAVGIDKSEETNDYLITAESGVENTGLSVKRLLVSRNTDNLDSFDKKSTWIENLISSDNSTRIIVIGKDILENKDSLSEFAEDIKHSSQINKKTMFVVADNKACDIINIENQNYSLIGDYINECLSKLTKQSFKMTYSLTTAISEIQSYEGAVIPVVSMKDDTLCINGVAIIRDCKLLGYLDYTENSILSMLTNGSAMCLKDINIEIDYVPITLNCENANVSQDVELTNKNLSINYYITLNCKLNSYEIPIYYNSEEEFLRLACNEADKKLSKQTYELISKLQKIYTIDVLNVQNDLIRYNKSEYEKIANEYNSAFKNADITVRYNINIDNINSVR